MHQVFDGIVFCCEVIYKYEEWKMGGGISSLTKPTLKNTHIFKIVICISILENSPYPGTVVGITHIKFMFSKPHEKLS